MPAWSMARLMACDRRRSMGGIAAPCRPLGSSAGVLDVVDRDVSEPRVHQRRVVREWPVLELRSLAGLEVLLAHFHEVDRSDVEQEAETRCDVGQCAIDRQIGLGRIMKRLLLGFPRSDWTAQVPPDGWNLSKPCAKRRHEARLA